MFDRLAELQAQSKVKVVSNSADYDSMESGNMDQSVFKIMDEIKGRIDLILVKVSEIKTLRFEAIDALSADEEKKISKAVQNLVRQCNTEASQIKNELEQFAIETDRFYELHGSTRSAELKIRRATHVSSVKKLSETLQALHAEHEAFNEAMKEKGVRTIQMVYPDASSEEVNEMMMLGASSVMQQRVQRGVTSSKMALSDLRETLADIKSLEESVREVHMSIQQLNSLVQAQGDVIDAIESHITSTNEYTSAANEEIISSALYKRKADRNKIICIIGIIVILIVVGIVLYFVLKPEDKNNDGNQTGKNNGSGGSPFVSFEFPDFNTGIVYLPEVKKIMRR